MNSTPTLINHTLTLSLIWLVQTVMSTLPTITRPPHLMRAVESEAAKDLLIKNIHHSAEASKIQKYTQPMYQKFKFSPCTYPAKNNFWYT